MLSNLAIHELRLIAEELTAKPEWFQFTFSDAFNQRKLLAQSNIALFDLKLRLEKMTLPMTLSMILKQAVLMKADNQEDVKTMGAILVWATRKTFRKTLANPKASKAEKENALVLGRAYGLV